MTDNNCVNVNFERTVINFNFNDGGICLDDKVFAAIIMQMLEEKIAMLDDDEALKFLMECGTKPEALQALPPWAQREREEKALIELLKEEGFYNSDLEDFPIITENEDGSFHIETKNHSIDAKVVYDPQVDHMCGPARFHIEITSVVEKSA